MRLIDADALPKYTGFALSADEVATAVENAPTIDAVEVVRCKDCRFFEDEDYYGNCYCEEWGNITNSNGYCHDAKRRKDEDK